MPIETSAAPLTKVPMSGIGYGCDGEELETLLGSCVGVAIRDRITSQSALAHVVLADSRGADATPGKFADTAIDAMREELLRRGANPLGFEAKIAGGADMFGKAGKKSVGNDNILAVREHLSRNDIKITGEHTGGTKGRVILFSTSSGTVEVRIGRESVATL